jgi:large subunit ribosomal protein L4
MAKVSLIKLNGEKVKDITLEDGIWNIEINKDILSKALRLSLASQNQGTKKTKTRGEVSGSGKKPWKQKGTGRARAGQKRSPVWVGGGHTFALTSKVNTIKMNKKERVIALKSALSSKFQNKELIVIEEIKLANLKTKELKDVLKTLKINNKTLFVTVDDNENLYMASRNLTNVGHIMASELNILDLINSDTLVLDEASVKYVEEVLK